MSKLENTMLGQSPFDWLKLDTDERYMVLSKALCDRHIYVRDKDEWFDVVERAMISPRALNTWYRAIAPKDEDGRPILATTMLSAAADLRRATGLEYAPGQEIFFVNEDEKEMVNSWRAPTVEPVAGNVQPFLDHIDLLCNSDALERDHFLDFLAYIAQNPGKKVRHGILIQGNYGVGKDTLAALMLAVLGEGNVRPLNQNRLLSKFNSWVTTSQLLVVSELHMKDANGFEAIKEVITNSRLDVEFKGVDAGEKRNCANFLLFTNHDAPIVIPEGDRRLFVIKCRAAVPDEFYFNRLYDWLKSDAGASALRHFMLSRDLSKFDPNKAPPMTEAKRALLALSVDEQEQWLDAALMAHEDPFRAHVVAVKDIEDYCRDNNIRISNKKIALWLSGRAKARSIGQKRVASGRKVLWAVRHHDFFATAATDDQIKKAYDGLSVGVPEIDDPDGATAPRLVIDNSNAKADDAVKHLAQAVARGDQKAVEYWTEMLVKAKTQAA